MSEIKQRILDTLRDKGAMTLQQLSAEKPTWPCSPWALSAAVRELEEAGEITGVANVSGDQHRLWSLAVKGGEGVPSDE